jgi:hypothetical protein
MSLSIVQQENLFRQKLIAEATARSKWFTLWQGYIETQQTNEDINKTFQTEITVCKPDLHQFQYPGRSNEQTPKKRWPRPAVTSNQNIGRFAWMP